MITKKLHRLLEDLGSAAAKSVATTDSAAKEAAPTADNDKVYPADEHKQAEEVKEVVVESSYPFVYINDLRTGKLNESAFLREEAEVKLTKNTILVDLPASKKSGLTKIEEQLLVESLLDISNLLSNRFLTEEEVTTEIQDGAKATVDLTDDGVKITIAADSPSDTINQTQAEQLEESLLMIDSVLSENFSVEAELDRVVELVEGFVSLPLQESDAFVNSLNEDALFLLETSIDQYNTLLEIGVVDAVKVGMRKVGDWWKKGGIDRAAKKSEKSIRGNAKNTIKQSKSDTISRLKEKRLAAKASMEKAKRSGDTEAIEKAKAKSSQLGKLLKPRIFMSADEKKKFDSTGGRKSIASINKRTDDIVNRRKGKAEAAKNRINAATDKVYKKAQWYDTRGGKSGVKKIAEKGLETKKENRIDSVRKAVEAGGRPMMDTPRKEMIKFGNTK